MRRLVWLALVAGCDRQEALEAGADVLQGMGPVREIDIHVNGFHYAARDMTRQMEADHYCDRKSDQLIECVLYDGTGKEAHMVGLEHIVSREVFDALPREEKVLWHPHTYEVKSGTLIAPGLPVAAEHALMEELVTTYGKTWHVWDADAHEWPMDVPMLMKGFTADGQLDPALLASRDARFGVDSAKRREDRADIPDPGFDPIVLEEPTVCQSVLAAPGGG